MPQEVHIQVSPEQAYTEENIRNYIIKNLNIDEKDISKIRILKRAVDARRKSLKVNLWLRLFGPDETPEKQIYTNFNYQDVSGKPEVIIVGAGPAGIFAALRLIELGLKPIILEQGKNVRDRKKDIAEISKNQPINEKSNYCFGEGGAGAFSDGKLYTRSNKRGESQRILDNFCKHGAYENIMYDARPHIGSDKLPTVVENMVKTIVNSGGEVHFETTANDILLKNNKITGCATADGRIFEARALVLATGHSAHGIYELLQSKGVLLEQKGFAMGVRAEHPQSLINSIQYNMQNAFLPAATYSIVEQIEGRGVYSFCMCPGGHIVPAASGENQIVVNGMSTSKHNSEYANAGIVVEIRPEDIPEEYSKYGALAGLKFQQYVENLAFLNNENKGLMAPAQRLTDFVFKKQSIALQACSYAPGVVSSPIHSWLPDMITRRLQTAFRSFDRRLHGFFTVSALIVGVESRTSSPVRIPRDYATMQHIEVEGLFPCGEGAGYAGGIVSSAMDGENVARKIYEFFNK